MLTQPRCVCVDQRYFFNDQSCTNVKRAISLCRKSLQISAFITKGGRNQQRPVYVSRSSSISDSDDWKETLSYFFFIDFLCSATLPWLTAPYNHPVFTQAHSTPPPCPHLPVWRISADTARRMCCAVPATTSSFTVHGQVSRSANLAR